MRKLNCKLLKYGNPKLEQVAHILSGIESNIKTTSSLGVNNLYGPMDK